MKTEIKTTVDFKVTLQLSEAEARAFEAIIGYGWKPFQEFFYKNLGSHYLKPYEAAAKEMFERRQEINFQLYNIDKVKKAINDTKLNPGLEFECETREAKPD